MLRGIKKVCSIKDRNMVFSYSRSRPRFQSYHRNVNTQKIKCDADFLRTNLLADYLDKLSTDVNYISYIEEEDDHQSYIQLFIVIAIFIFMFYAPKDR